MKISVAQIMHLDKGCKALEIHIDQLIQASTSTPENLARLRPIGSAVESYRNHINSLMSGELTIKG